MRLFRISQIVVALAFVVAGGEIVQAAGPGGFTSSFRNKSWFSKTITTSVYQAPLSVNLNNDNFDSSATGLAEYKVIEIDITFCGRTWTRTCTSLSVSLSNLPTVDNNQVTFEINEDESNEYGPLTVTNGSASYYVSSKCGGIVPTIAAGDTIEVDAFISSEEWDIVEGTFGAAVVTVTTCGR